MNTLTEKDEHAEQGSNVLYRFDADGECSNPERVEVPMPAGYQCALFVARQPDGQWTFGCILAGKRIELVKLPARIVENGDPSRASALVTAREMMVQNLPDNCPPTVQEALTAFGTAKETVQGVIAETVHKWSRDGVCSDPECISIGVEPAPVAQCVIQVAQAPDGTWRAGYFGSYAFVKDIDNVESFCRLSERGYQERKWAMRAAFDALEAYWTTLPKNKWRAKSLKALASFKEANLSSTDAPSAVASPATPRGYRTSFAELLVAKIQRSPANHRKHFDPVQLRELADSILTEGLHQPIAVRRLLASEQPDGELPLGDPGAAEYELIFGERRWRALQLAGINVVTAKVYEDMPRERTHAIALIENLQREGINCMEEAEGYSALMAAETLTQEQCAERLGKGRSTVANCLRLLKLSDRVREHLREERLTLAHGVALARFVPADKERDAVPKWEMIVNHMADECVRDKAPAGNLERGVPSVYGLCQAGLAVRINQWSEYKLTDKLKKHAAYFAVGDGDWVCFDPPHWDAEIKIREDAKKAREEKARQAREAEIAKAAKSGRRQVVLADLNSDEYREFEDAHASLVDLVPQEKRAVAKNFEGQRITIVTDVGLADRLKNAMVRVIKKNRKEAIATLQDKVLKKVFCLKKIGPREIAWLVYQLTTYEGRRVSLSLTEDAAKVADVKLPKAIAKSAAGSEELDEDYSAEKERLRKNALMSDLSKCDGVSLVKTLIVHRLESALTDIVEAGPESIGAQFVRWWLDSDTLWLLEETEDGRAELVDLVKNAPWYAKVLAGEPSEEGEE